MEPRTVLITGAAGNLGGKLRQHLAGRYPLVLLDRVASDSAIQMADLARPGDWTRFFQGVEVVFHFAADPVAQQTWPALIAPNLDLPLQVFHTAAACGVRRIVYASSNHVLGGYKDRAEPHLLTPDTPPLPGTRYEVAGEHRDSSAYAATKLFGERLGLHLTQTHDMEFIAVRIGWTRQGENRAADLPCERDWFRRMWLSNRDFCHLMERCLVAELPTRFVVVNGMSNNAEMRWCLESTRRMLGYQPLDGVTGDSQPLTHART